MVLGCFLGVVFGLYMMAMGQVSVMPGSFMLAGFMMFRGDDVMLGCLLVM
jgi:hypothetical protein